MTAAEVFESVTGSVLEIQLTTDPLLQKSLVDAKLMGVLNERVPVAWPISLARGLLSAWSDQTRDLDKRKTDERDLLRLLEAYPNRVVLMPEEISQQLPE